MGSSCSRPAVAKDVHNPSENDTPSTEDNKRPALSMTDSTASTSSFNSDRAENSKKVDEFIAKYRCERDLQEQNSDWAGESLHSDLQE